MKILNKILKYFETETTSSETYVKTSFDNIQDKNTSFYLDNEIQGLKRSIDLINKVLTPIESDFPQNLYVDESKLIFRKWNNLVVVYGNFYPKITIPHEQEIVITTLPVGLRPSTNIETFSYEINTNTHIRIRILSNGVVDIYVYGNKDLQKGNNTQLNLAYCVRTKEDFNEQ